MDPVDEIGKLVIKEIMRIRLETNRARRKLGLPVRDYSQEPINSCENPVQ